MTQGPQLLLEAHESVDITDERKSHSQCLQQIKLCTQLHRNFQNSRQCTFSRDKQKTKGQHKPLTPPILESCHVRQSSAIFLDHFKHLRHVRSRFFSCLTMEKKFTGCETWQMYQTVHWVSTAFHACACHILTL